MLSRRARPGASDRHGKRPRARSHDRADQRPEDHDAVRPRPGRDALDGPAGSTSHLFHAEPDPARPPYSIVIPPPNITGKLHMGHALNDAIQDALTRYHRMLGRQRLLAARHRPRRHRHPERGREAAAGAGPEQGGRGPRRVRRGASGRGASSTAAPSSSSSSAWAAPATTSASASRSTTRYVQARSSRCSWRSTPRATSTRTTTSSTGARAAAPRSATSRSSTSTRPATSTTCATSSQGGGSITIATTRPETMLGDTAVAVNPDRRALPRRRRAHGAAAAARARAAGGRRRARRPRPSARARSRSRRPTTSPTSTSAATTACRPSRSSVPTAASPPRAGPTPVSTIGEARERVVADLRAAGALVKVDDYTHSVATCHRCGTHIEPLISLQWFMRMDELKAPAIEAVRDGRVRFVPERWGRVYVDWMENLRPWCISRQLWWGHQLPVWYCESRGLRRDDRRRAGAAAPARAAAARPCAARPTCSTPGSARRCGRSPPGAGPTQTRRPRLLLPDRTCSARRARSSSSGSRAWS